MLRYQSKLVLKVYVFAEKLFLQILNALNQVLQKWLSHLVLEPYKTQTTLSCNLSYDEKIAKMGLRPDRADVIVPATELFLLAMSKSGCKEVIVPKVGLADGIIHQLYEEYRSKNTLFAK